MEQETKIQPKGSIEAKVIRKDGTVEDLGEIANTDWKIWSRARWRARKRIKQANKRKG